VSFDSTDARAVDRFFQKTIWWLLCTFIVYRNTLLITLKCGCVQRRIKDFVNGRGQVEMPKARRWDAEGMRGLGIFFLEMLHFNALLCTFGQNL